MDSLQVFISNFCSPPVIAFFTGIIAVLVRSDLKFPSEVYQGLTIYLLLAIGFKGGTALSQSSLQEIALPIAATLAFGAIIPVVVFFASMKFLKFSVANGAAMAAHYGSVSAVTFMATLAFLDKRFIEAESFMPALMAVMEIPAIVAALFMARIYSPEEKLPWLDSLREVLTGKSIILIICGLVTGLVSSKESVEVLKPFLVTPFYGILMIFLLEMGLVAGAKLKDARQAGFPLIAFSIIIPLIFGTLGLLTGKVIGLSQGGSVVFALLLASASYIAAPAAVRIALPNANPGYYVTASLGITFPFNLLVGIPLFFSISELVF